MLADVSLGCNQDTFVLMMYKRLTLDSIGSPAHVTVEGDHALVAVLNQWLNSAILTFIVGGKTMTDSVARRKQLHAIARAYVTEGLGKKNFDAIPYDDTVTLRAPLCPGGMDVPLTGKEKLREVWWAPLPPLIGTVTLLDTYVNDDLTAVTCEFTLEIVPLATSLRILDRFIVNNDGNIMEQSNYFDPRNVTNPGWQNA